MKKSLLVLIILLVVSGGLIAYFVTRPTISEQGQGTQQPVVPTSTPSILGVTMSKSISATGEPLNPATVFSPATANIYAVLSLKDAMRSTQLAYIRKYNGKYVDSKVSHPPKDGVKTFYFEWSLMPGQTRKVGTYAITFYVNGIRSLTASYTVK